MSARDYYGNNPDHPWAPARQAFAITADDEAEVTPIPTRGLLVTGDGSLAIRPFDSDADVTMDVVAGQYIPIVPLLVKESTTATVLGLG